MNFMMNILAALLVAIFFTAIGYAFASFLFLEWPWNFREHMFGRVWFVFWLVISIGALFTPDEAEQS